MTNVNIRLSPSELERIDQFVEEGRFTSRSDAIRMMVAAYQEREKTKEFYNMLKQRSRDAKANPKRLVSLEDL